MNIKKSIKKHPIQTIFPTIIGICSYFFVSIYSEIIQTYLPTVIQGLSKSIILKLLLVAVILLILSSVVSLILYLQLKVKLIPKFGVYWDKNNEPYCPNCKNLLNKRSYKTKETTKVILTCLTHDKINIDLVNDNGEELSIDKAIKLLTQS